MRKREGDCLPASCSVGLLSLGEESCRFATNSDDPYRRFEMVMKRMMIATATEMTETLFLGSNDLVSIVLRWASYLV
jgi:hypothetical protein